MSLPAGSSASVWESQVAYIYIGKCTQVYKSDKKVYASVNL